jgi:hypothetical protein
MAEALSQINVDIGDYLLEESSMLWVGDEQFELLVSPLLQVTLQPTLMGGRTDTLMKA